jgi:hypothetical protein
MYLPASTNSASSMASVPWKVIRRCRQARPVTRITRPPGVPASPLTWQTGFSGVPGIPFTRSPGSPGSPVALGPATRARSRRLRVPDHHHRLPASSSRSQYRSSNRTDASVGGFARAKLQGACRAAAKVLLDAHNARQRLVARRSGSVCAQAPERAKTASWSWGAARACGPNLDPGTSALRHRTTSFLGSARNSRSAQAISGIAYKG